MTDPSADDLALVARHGSSNLIRWLAAVQLAEHEDKRDYLEGLLTENK
ncbi:hypothetical protein [Haladaptatus sp. DFWS20]